MFIYVKRGLSGFICVNLTSLSRTLHLDSCSVNVHMHELRKYYSDIRSNAISEDSEIGVKLLDKSLMTTVQVRFSRCCFLRLLLRFYVERVFSNYASSQPQQQRCSSALANAFVSIRRDIHKCVSSFFNTFVVQHVKKHVGQAAQKAVGELDTVLEWLEGQRTQT
uniref:Interleukin-20-like n=1 Tax=Stegastes partitus TaxID=144197 RepID=A0A3B5AA08_9TELE